MTDIQPGNRLEAAALRTLAGRPGRTAADTLLRVRLVTPIAVAGVSLVGVFALLAVGVAVDCPPLAVSGLVLLAPFAYTTFTAAGELVDWVRRTGPYRRPPN